MKSFYKKLFIAAGAVCVVGVIAGMLCAKLHRSAAKKAALAEAGSADGSAEPVPGSAEPVPGSDCPDCGAEETKESDGASDEEE